ncbi:hypothetical protein F2Q69_00049480 [Brassica cretica]|uniref:Uncharacterized protein n=1 Tax=Brassica cretica TaxID=69181 RepID=A0A8S9PZK8_BRACR|nr:hypothetical protein F2Q69_00049480 [Brassica cretica]
MLLPRVSKSSQVMLLAASAVTAARMRFWKQRSLGLLIYTRSCNAVDRGDAPLPCDVEANRPG